MEVYNFSYLLFFARDACSRDKRSNKEATRKNPPKRTKKRGNPAALTYECSKNEDDANDDESLDGGESLSLRNVIRNTGTVL